MQTRFQFLLFTLVTAAMVFSSCSKSNKEGRYIPSNASFAMVVNGASLNEKLSWEEIRKNEAFQMVYNDTNTSALAKSILDNPENSGIDVKKDMVFFVIQDSAGNYLAFEGSVKDEAAFSKFNKDAGKGMAVESESNGIKFSNTKEMTVAWNKEKFVLLAETNNNSANRFRDMYDSTTTDEPEIKKDRVPVVEALFNLKEDKSLAKEEKFSDLMKENGDIHFWVNMESFYAGNNNIPGMAALSMINLKKIYEDSRVTGTVNFDNGKIKVDFNSYSGKEMTALVKKYSGDKIDAEMIKRIPSKNLAGMFALNFKPQGLVEYMKLLGIEGFANMGTNMLGFTVDDFIKANKGDILLAVTDISKDSRGKPDASVIFSASVGDKVSFGKLVEAGKKFGKDKLSGENGPSVFYNINDKYFAIGNKKQQVDSYISTLGNPGVEFFDKISNSAGGMYLNLQYILKSMGNQVPSDSLATAMFDASVKMWDNVYSWGDGFKNGASVQHFEINMMDKSTNSLKQLNNYISTMGVLTKKKNEEYKKTFSDDMIDSTIAPAK